MTNEEIIEEANVLMKAFAKDTNIYNFAESALLNAEKLETVKRVWNYGLDCEECPSGDLSECDCELEKYNMLDKLLEVQKNDD